MATDYSLRLARLKERRQGVEQATLSKAFAAYYPQSESASFREAYENRGKTDTVKYVLGAMQEVDQKYTQTSFDEGKRVINQLQNRLTNFGINSEFEFQGSVPLNIHIKQHSDIDVLVIHGDILTYDSYGIHGSSGHYKPITGTVLQRMLGLRNACESSLDAAFWGADINKAGAKSIALNGGAFKRKVDVVPSHWHDTALYQRTREKHYREIKILDKFVPETLSNLPFLHMKMINDKDAECGGGIKKVIRLLKTLKADCDKAINLSSYDIASIVWHFNSTSVWQRANRDLALLAMTMDELDAMCGNYTRASLMITPDGSRKIFDDAQKFTDLNKLASEVRGTASDIAGELDCFAAYRVEGVQSVLESTFV